MPRRTENTHANPTPHFDGKRDGVLNDPTGHQIGVKMDAEQSKNPLHANEIKEDKALNEFEEITRGEPIDD